jgi:hypothetical protein
MPLIADRRDFQLDCTSYLSFMPTLDTLSRSMTSNMLYAAYIDKATNLSTKTSAPGYDYDFFPDSYPVTWNMPDLSDQIDAFLSMKKPQNAPAETLWVFTFGTWDIWSLASMPSEVSFPMVTTIASHLFNEIERLYRHSLDENSIAWSNFTATPRYADYLAQLKNKTTAINTTETVIKTNTGNVRGQPLVTGLTYPEPAGSHLTAVNVDDDKIDIKLAERFRILIPNLFDPSLTPGWQTDRPKSPGVHSLAEQMRNAAELTHRWNREVRSQMISWIDGNKNSEQLMMQSISGASDLETAVANFVKNGDSITLIKALTAAKAAGSLDDRSIVEEYQRALLQRTQQVGPGSLVAANILKSGPSSVQSTITESAAPTTTNAADHATVASSATEPSETPVKPIRDGLVYDMPGYLLDSIVDRQLRNAGLKDANGNGAGSTMGGFLEVASPCIMEEAVAYDHGDDEPELETTPSRTETKLLRRGAASADLVAPTPDPEADTVGPWTSTKSSHTRMSVCEAPQEYLFYTGFTLSDRAINDIAKRAALQVRNNESIRFWRM